MSGGIAYVYDPDGRFPARCNLEMVELEKLEDTMDIAELKQIVEQHRAATDSAVARGLLDAWDAAVTRFHKVMPSEYKRALQEMEEEAHYAASSSDGEASDLPGGIKLPVIPDESPAEKSEPQMNANERK
jgi:glutamate synthase domain-containing protein 3